MTKNNKKRRPVVEATPQGAIKSSLPGTAAALVSALVMTLLGALIALLCPDPGAAARVTGYAVLYLSAFAGGFYAYRRCRAYPLLCGLYTGLSYTALTILLSLLLQIDEGGLSPALAFLLRAPIVLTAIVGGVAASYSPKRRRKRRR